MSAKIVKAFSSPQKAHRTANLGGGFYRFTFNRTIAANTFFTFTFLGGAYKPISGGFFIANQTTLPAYATSFYNQSDSVYIITVRNPSAFRRSIAFTFIAKL